MKLQKVEYLIVHHTATDRDHTTFEAVKRYHISKGWDDIGYHFFIDGKGGLFVGRPETKVGVHCRASGMNFRSLGICLAGNFETQYPSAVQLLKLSQTLNHLVDKYLILPDQILGHCEVPRARTVCPGKNLLYWLDIYRRSFSKKKVLLIKIARMLRQIKIFIQRLKKVSNKLPVDNSS